MMAFMVIKMKLVTLKVSLHRFLIKSQKVRENHQKKDFKIRKSKRVSICLRTWKWKMTISKNISIVSNKNSPNGDKNMIFQRQKQQKTERIINSKGKKD